MIRINLLETAEKKRRRKRQLPTGTPVVALYVLLLLLEGVLLYYWSAVKEDALVQQRKMTQELQKQVESFKKLKEERDELATKMAEEEQQARIFENLAASTVGPANMLMYLAYMLSTPPLANHAERVVQEQIGWDTQWDPDRAWVTSFSEGREKDVVIEGLAISHHDTDEFLKRVKSTVYFQNVQFVTAKVGGGKKGTSQELIEFKVRASINYDLNVGKQAAEAEPEEGKGKGGNDKKKPNQKKG
jgi:Tfp pilus assembly protein PilN